MIRITARPLHTPRLGRAAVLACARVIRRGALQWARAAVLLSVAVGLPLQGLAQVMQRAAAPAHFHTTVRAGGSGDAPAPLAWRSAAHTHAHAQGTALDHRHGPGGGATSLDRLSVALAAMSAPAEPERHAHDLSEGGVVYLAADADAPASPGGSAKSPPVDGVLLAVAHSVPALPEAPDYFAALGGDAFHSHIAEPLKRPPR